MILLTIAFGTVLVISGAVLVRSYRKNCCIDLKREAKPAPWTEEDVHEVGSNHTQVAGFLAGFTITVFVLISTYDFRSRASAFSAALEEAVLGTFLLAFLCYVVTGILYSVAIRRHQPCQQAFVFSAASCLYYFSVVLSFSALRPLLLMLGYPELTTALNIMIVGAAIGGYFAVCIATYDLLQFSFRLCSAVFFLGLSTVGLAFGASEQILVFIPGDLVPQYLLRSSAAFVLIVFGVCMVSFFWKRFEDKSFARVITILTTYLVTVLVLAEATWTLLIE